MGSISILDQIKERESKRPKCAIAKFKQTLTEAESIEFEEMLTNKKYARVGIVEVLKNNGFNIAESQLYKHINKVCACNRG